MTLQAALERWETAMPVNRDGRDLRDVDQVLQARCTLLRDLLELGWQIPMQVRHGLRCDELLLNEVHGVTERFGGR